MLAYKDGARVRLVSRNGRDHTRRFCDIGGRLEAARCTRSCWTAKWRSSTRNSGRGSRSCASPTPDAVQFPVIRYAS